MWQGKPMIPGCDVENKMLWRCNNWIFRQCPLKEMENKSLGMERKCRELLELKAIMILVRVYVCNGKKNLQKKIVFLSYNEVIIV